MSILSFSNPADRARADLERINGLLREAYAARQRDLAEHVAAVDAALDGAPKASKEAQAAGDLLGQRDRRIADLEGAQRRAQERLDRAEAAERAKVEGERQRAVNELAAEVIRKAQDFRRAASETGQAWAALADAARVLASEANDTRLTDCLTRHALGGRCGLQLAKAGLHFLAPDVAPWDLEHRVADLPTWLAEQFAIARRRDDDGPQAA